MKYLYSMIRISNADKSLNFCRNGLNLTETIRVVN